MLIRFGVPGSGEGPHGHTGEHTAVNCVRVPQGVSQLLGVQCMCPAVHVDTGNVCAACVCRGVQGA
jgi:hypothetical protein